MLNKAYEVSRHYISGKALIDFTYQLAYNYMYYGDSSEFWKKIQELKKLCRHNRKNDELGKAYGLEAIFHVYNKNFELAVEHCRRGLETASDMETVSFLTRQWGLAYLVNHKWDEFESFMQGKDRTFAEYGFNMMIDLYYAKNREEVEAAFDSYLETSTLWKEEVALIFFEKCTRFIPEKFEIYINRLVREFNEDGEKTFRLL